VGPMGLGPWPLGRMDPMDESHVRTDAQNQVVRFPVDIRPLSIIWNRKFYEHASRQILRIP
jgi:hypothetical protein